MHSFKWDNCFKKLQNLTHDFYKSKWDQLMKNLFKLMNKKITTKIIPEVRNLTQNQEWLLDHWNSPLCQEIKEQIFQIHETLKTQDTCYYHRTIQMLWVFNTVFWKKKYCRIFKSSFHLTFQSAGTVLIQSNITVCQIKHWLLYKNSWSPCILPLLLMFLQHFACKNHETDISPTELN